MRQALLTSAIGLYEGERSVQRFVLFTRDKTTFVTHSVVGCLGPTAVIVSLCYASRQENIRGYMAGRTQLV
jgi:hypothetical protein